MTIYSLGRYLAVALSFMGSAILLFSCEKKQAVEETSNYETLMTEYSENMSIDMSENGSKSYYFETPLIEGYAMARDPYREFRKGIKITMYEKDSARTASVTLVANYAIFYEERKLWEAKGDVKVVQANGRKLNTSQLFWNQATHTIYSNVDCIIIDRDQTIYCEGFESDEEMKEWSYRKVKGVTYFEDSQLQSGDAESSTAAEEEKK
ncbi:MAG: LPS export ABC transporter periplasmic protein LptC [Alistipes sp.]|nr:LPS export ABC transporter periplasmic protein LptC [Alistipes sp.]